MKPMPTVCPVCGRKLTAKESIARGIGPTCEVLARQAFLDAHLHLW